MGLKKLIPAIGLALGLNSCMQNESVQPDYKGGDDIATPTSMNFTGTGVEIAAHCDAAHSVTGFDTDMNMSLKSAKAGENFNAGLYFTRFQPTQNLDSAYVEAYLMRHTAYTWIADTDTNGVNNGFADNVMIGNTSLRGKCAIGGDIGIVGKQVRWTKEQALTQFADFKNPADNPQEDLGSMLLYRVNIPGAFSRESVQHGLKKKEFVHMTGTNL